MKATDYLEFTPAQIAAEFSCNPETGEIFRLRSPRTDTIGPVPKIVGTGGYLVVWGLGRLFRAHRIVWVLCKGKWPKHDIDHINRKRTENMIGNLREATRAQNLRNMTRRKCKSGYKGVYKDDTKKTKKFCAYIFADKKKRHLGSYVTAKEAHAAYIGAARMYSGEFATGGE